MAELPLALPATTAPDLHIGRMLKADNTGPDAARLFTRNVALPVASFTHRRRISRGNSDPRERACGVNTDLTPIRTSAGWAQTQDGSRCHPAPLPRLTLPRSPSPSGDEKASPRELGPYGPVVFVETLNCFVTRTIGSLASLCDTASSSCLRCPSSGTRKTPIQWQSPLVHFDRQLNVIPKDTMARVHSSTAMSNDKVARQSLLCSTGVASIS